MAHTQMRADPAFVQTKGKKNDPSSIKDGNKGRSNPIC